MNRVAISGGTRPPRHLAGSCRHCGERLIPASAGKNRCSGKPSLHVAAGNMGWSYGGVPVLCIACGGRSLGQTQAEPPESKRSKGTEQDS